MATLRDRLTPAEQQRFKTLYNQGYFDPITLERFTKRLGDELRYIDMLELRRKQAQAAIDRIPGTTAAEMQRRSELGYTIEHANREIPKRRAGLFDASLSDNLLDRERRVRQNLAYASMMRPDGTPAPGGVPFGAPEAEKTLMHQAWDTYWDEKGIIRGGLDIAASAVTGPIRGAQQLSTGSLGENPYEALAEIGSFLPMLRAGGRLAAAGSRATAQAAANAAAREAIEAGASSIDEVMQAAAKAAAEVSQTGVRGTLRRVVDDPFWTIPSYSAQVADMIGAEEGAWIEAVGEAGMEGLGAGADLFRHLRGRSRSRGILQGLDPQAAEDAQTTEATTEHDQVTGSTTSPGGTLGPHTIWTEHQLRRQAWERMLIEAEEREAAEANQAASVQSLIDQDDAYTQQQQSQQQAASEQSLIDQDEAYTQQQQSQQQAADQQQAAAEDQARADEQQAASEQSLIDQDTAYTEQQTQQQAAEAERVAYTQEWLPFYADLAGGSQAEGIQTLNQEYDAGVRNPIEHRYNQIAASLQSQLGAIPSELHRETDRRLRQLIGEKWYNIYRGIDDGRPTPQQRAARAAAAAEKIVEGDTDGEPDPDSEGTDGAAAQQASTDTSEEAPEQAATQTPEETEETPDTPPQEEETEVRNPARVGEIVVGYETDATTAHRVRPVLGDLDDVIPSHSPTGEEREEYPQGLQPRKTRGGPSSLRLARKRAENPNINQMLTFPGHFRDGPPIDQ